MDGGGLFDSTPFYRDEPPIRPFSVLDARTPEWKSRRSAWMSLGIEQNDTRENAKAGMRAYNTFMRKNIGKSFSEGVGISIFDPVLCEVMYRWFCPEGGKILDPFAGGSVRGVVASLLGYDYLGIDIRREQVESNRAIAEGIISSGIMPRWIEGDSLHELDNLYGSKFDMVFSCPPYFDLEVYSDIDGDLSNMGWKRFVVCFREIVRKCCLLLSDGGIAAFVIGDVRSNNTYYRGLVPMCIKAFLDCGMGYMNEAVFCPPPFTAYLRAKGCIEHGKLVKTHQNVLVFQKIPQTGMRKNLRSYPYL